MLRSENEYHWNQPGNEQNPKQPLLQFYSLQQNTPHQNAVLDRRGKSENRRGKSENWRDDAKKDQYGTWIVRGFREA